MLSDRLALAFPVFAVALLTALSFWLDAVVRTADPRNAAVRHDPDFIVDNFTARQTGPEGLLVHTLRAQRIELARRQLGHLSEGPPPEQSHDDSHCLTSGPALSAQVGVRPRPNLCRRPNSASSVFPVSPPRVIVRTYARISATWASL